MKRVLLTGEAACDVMRIREDKFGTFSEEKCAIADALCNLAAMISLGRDNEEMANCADRILKVMCVLDRYNDLLNTLHETDDRCYGKFEYVEPKQDYDPNRDSAVWGDGVDLLKGVFEKHPEIKEINVPASVDAITMEEAAEVLGCSVDELMVELEKERRASHE